MNRSGMTFKIFLGLFIFAGNVAWAEGIPSALLLDEKKECVAECGLSGNNLLVCEALCSCTVDQFSKLNLAQYMAIKSELDLEGVSAETQSYLAEVGAICVGELDKLVGGLALPPTTE